MRHTLITNRARAMRKAMTDPEVILWTRLRGRRGEQPTFRRQHAFGSIILDFYCPSLRLAVEVDGATHWDEDQQRKDAARDAWLARLGVHALRIPASRVYNDLHGVMDEILLTIEALKRGGAASAAARPLHPPLFHRLAPASAGGPPPAASRGR